MKFIMEMKFALLPLFLASLPLHGEQALPLEEQWRTEEPVPQHVKLTLRLPQTVMIGQEIPAALVVHNGGTQPFNITPGGDYRSTGYPTRMKVRVHDAAGKMLPELPREAYGMNGGGLSGPSSVAAGTSKEVEFPLDCYVSFTQPGVYTITAVHDLGWKLDALHPHPVAQASLKVTQPTAAEAKSYVEAAFARQPTISPRDNSETLQREWKLEKTLSVLRHPVFLPALIQRAQAGSKAAVKGIGQIATPEATAELLALLEHASAEVVETSAQQLMRRLPSLKDSGMTAFPYYWGSPYQIEPLLPAAWEPRFEKPLLTAALKLLEHESEAVVQLAAQFLQTRGTAEHAPQVLAVLQKSLNVYHAPRSGTKANTLDPPAPQGALMMALDGMRQRGWRLVNGSGGTALMVAWFRQLADKEVPKPQNNEWKTSMLTWVENGPPALKVCALQAIPQPLSDDAAKAVMVALDDADLRVQRVACEVAGASKGAEFARPLAQVLELEHESFLQNAAHNAAVACGGTLELWEAWASVIPDKDRMHDAVRALMLGTIQLDIGGGGSGNSNFTREQRFFIRDAWRAFLQQHRKQLAASNKVPPPDAATIATLTGANFQPDNPAAEITLKDGSRWPPRLPKK